ncbi:MAG: hypothetical protein QXL86_02185 [Candidatus Aenigmatarchaeota archaeon]
MKGIVEFVLVAAIAILLVWGTYWHLLIGKTVEFQLMTAEREILKAINKMEQIKIGLPYAIEYSFDKASYELGQKGGYNSIPSNVPTKDGLPYWREGNNYYIPDWLSETAKATGYYLDEYIKAATGDSIDIKVTIDKANVNVSSKDLLTLKGTNYKVEIIPNISVRLIPYRFKIYEVAEKYVKDNCGEMVFSDTTDPDSVLLYYYSDKNEVMVIDQRYNITIWNSTSNSYEQVHMVLKFKVKC